MIKLLKPLIWFDVETTGTSIKNDNIIEIYAKKYLPNGNIEELHHLICPSIDIDENATKVHGYTKNMLLKYPSFKEVSDEIYNFFNNCDYGGYNVVSFDIPILFEELYRCGYTLNIFKSKVIDPFKIVNKFDTRTLGGYYKNLFNKEIENPHNANSDVEACIEIFECQMDKYDIDNIEMANNISRCDKDGNKFLDYRGFFIMKNDIVYYNMGKHKDTPVDSNVEYLQWIILNSNMDSNIIKVASLLYEKILKEKGMIN